MDRQGTPRGILDTNAVIMMERIDSEYLPLEPMITTITLAELSVGPGATSDPLEQAIRQMRVQQAESDFVSISFDSAAARAFSRVSASLRAAGRKPHARAFDALIAAIAISRDLPLYTCNGDDFRGISGLDVRRMPHPGDVRRS